MRTHLREFRTEDDELATVYATVTDTNQYAETYVFDTHHRDCASYENRECDCGRTVETKTTSTTTATHADYYRNIKTGYAWKTTTRDVENNTVTLHSLRTHLTITVDFTTPENRSTWVGEGWCDLSSHEQLAVIDLRR